MTTYFIGPNASYDWSVLIFLDLLYHNCLDESLIGHNYIYCMFILIIN